MQLIKESQVLFRRQLVSSALLVLVAALLIIPLASSHCSAAQLTVVKSGTGEGTVTSGPAGINCGSTCVYTFLDTDSVVLSAAHDGSSVFVGWDGCDQVAGSQCTVAANIERTVTALFDAVTSADYYVAPTGDDSNSGLGWSRPFQSIDMALSVAQTGEEIWVKAGIYTPPVISQTLKSSYFFVNKKVHLYGGFNGSETDRNSRDPQLNQTIVQARRVTYFGKGFQVDTGNEPGPGRARIDGFVIRDGWALGSSYPLNTGGGIFVDTGVPIIANCEIYSNDAIAGGGIGANYGTTIINSSIHHNDAQNYGGGIQSDRSIEVINSVVYSNESGFSGGGIAFWEGGVIDSTTVTDNTVYYSNDGVAGVHGYWQGTTMITNSIIWGNYRGDIPSEIGTGPIANAVVTYSNVRGGYSGAGNIDNEPGFANPASGDLRIQSFSASVNAGNDSAVPADFADLDDDGNTAEQLPIDIAGNNRFESTVDMGAHEYSSGLYTEYNLVVTVLPAGEAVVTGFGGSCSGSCNMNLLEGSQLTATAVPQSPYRFAYWQGCDSSSWDQCIITMDGAKAITAHVVNEGEDADNDSMDDWWEWYHFDSLERDGNLDYDDDGLLDKDEFLHGTDPDNGDSDGDGMPDLWEIDNNLLPLVNDAGLDADSDELTNLQEYQLGTNPQLWDSDEDEMPDGWEVTYGLNPLVDDADEDPDGDSVSNLNEYLAGTDPTRSHTLSYTAGPNGSITGDLSQTVYHNQDGSPVTAVPITGYHFVNWDDSSTENPRTDTDVTTDVFVTATFAIDTFNLSYTAGAGGSVTGDLAQTVDYNTDGTTVTAVPASGYHFVQWSDGSIENPRTDTSVTQDITVVADFSDTYTLTYTAGANGSLSGDSLQTVFPGGDGTTVTAVPASGYHFVQWSDGSTENPRTDTNVTSYITVEASFSDTYTLTYTAGANGSITGDLSQPVAPGGDGTAVTAVANANYQFVTWSDGVITSSRTDTNISAYLTVTATFSSITGGPVFTQISANDRVKLAIRSDATLWAWGENGRGQLGDETTLDRNVPTQIGSDTDWQTLVKSHGDHNFAIKTAGTLWAWGSNSYGQLGINSTDQQNAPIKINNDTDWQALSAGSNHTVAVKSGGTLWAWGNNYEGKLGDGTIIDRLIPKQIGLDTDWQTVAAGDQHTLALKTDGALWAWGRNYSGQLGDGTITYSLVPIQIGSDTDWQLVSAGSGFSLALKKDGTLWAWGSNSSGELGDSTNDNRTAPVRIGSASDWQKIATGNNHTVALKSDGTLWTWGSNGFGELGNGVTLEHEGTGQNVPIQLGTDTNWLHVSAGTEASIALKNDGGVWTWGKNYRGALGNGTFASKNSPTQVGTESNWMQILAGRYHSLAMKTDNGLWSWGANGYGQLGNSTKGSENSPISLGSESYQAIFGGYYHSMALKADHSLWGWGKNGHGELGDGTEDERLIPGQVNTEAVWRTVSGGSDHTIAIQTDGSLWGWGENDYWSYQLAFHKEVNVTTPMEIDRNEAIDWAVLAAGGDHTLALKISGTLWAWGRNGDGQLGVGDTVTSNTIHQVGSESWQSIAAGSRHSLAIKNDGSLWAWGKNSYGQLGDGTDTERHSPVKIGSDTDWIVVTCGNSHSLALKNNGSLWAWGENEKGQLGDGTNIDRNFPVQVGSGLVWQTVTSRGYHTLALKSDGTLWAWGENDEGQLGDGTAWSTVPILITEGKSYVVTPSVTGSGTIYPAVPQVAGTLSTAEFLLESTAVGTTVDVTGTCPAGILTYNGNGSWNYETGIIGSDCTVQADFSLSCDINGDGALDLIDIISGLQLLTGGTVSGVSTTADINGDGKIGLEEIIYILSEI